MYAHETGMERYQRMGAGKACLSCRRRKVKCEVSDNKAKCKACEKRQTECILVDPQKEHSIRGEESSSARTSKPPLTQPRPDAFAAELSFQDLDCDLLDNWGYGTGEGLSPDPLNLLQSLLGESGSNEDTLLGLPCFALPRCLVGKSNSDSSPLSILSADGKKWLHEQFGESNTVYWAPFTHPPSEIDSSDLFGDRRHSKPFIPLPPKNVGIYLLRVYFRMINPFCPIFDEEDFMLHAEQDYNVQPQRSPAWWACMNAALALACTVDSRFQREAWLYWKNATLSLDSFFIEQPHLSSAQALLAISLYLYGTLSSSPTHTFVSLAIHILHRLSPLEYHATSTHCRVLAICYGLDIDHSLRRGTPPTLPTTLSSESLPEILLDDPFPTQLHSESKHFDALDAFRNLTSIKGRIYRDLYSTSACKKPDAEIIATVGQLDSLLQEWKNNIPEEYRPGTANIADVIKIDPNLTTIYLHFSYYDSLIAIHRKAIPRVNWSMNLDPCRGQTPCVQSSNPRSLKSSQLCAGAARASMDLSCRIPWNHPLCAGTIVHFVVLALMVLSMLIVQDPQIARLNTDVMLMDNVERYFAAMSRADWSAMEIAQQCSQYRNLAEKAIRQALSSKVMINRGN